MPMRPGSLAGKKCLQLKQRYVLTPVKSGLMVIDQKRAHERILYEKIYGGAEIGFGGQSATTFPAKPLNSTLPILLC